MSFSLNALYSGIILHKNLSCQILLLGVSLSGAVQFDEIIDYKVAQALINDDQFHMLRIDVDLDFSCCSLSAVSRNEQKATATSLDL